jgi:hypothetical protein
VKELERQRESKRDFIADGRNLEVFADGGKLYLTGKDEATVRLIGSGLSVEIMDQALPQVASRVSPKIPSKWVKEMRDEWPQHMADILTTMLRDTGKRRLVRILDGQCRAFLSDRYRILDNYDLAFASLDAARNHGAEVMEAAISDKKMKLKLINKQLWDKIDMTRSNSEKSDWYAGGLGNQEHLGRVSARSTGDLPGGPGTVWPIATISNSETGHGGLSVRLGILAGICFNLATVEEVASMIHLGQQNDVGIFQPETCALEARAIMAKCADAIRAAFTPEVFSALVERCRHAQDQEVKDSIEAVNNFVASTDLISDDAKDSLLRYFVQDYDPTVWGFSNAVSRLSQDYTNSDVATEIEELAGTVITAPETVGIAVR